MFLAFFFLLMFCGVVAFMAWVAWQRVTAHMRANPEAARLVAEHIIAPLLTGEKEPQIDQLDEVPDPKPEPK